MDTCETCGAPIGKFPVVDDLGRQFCSIDCAVDANNARIRHDGQLGLFVPLPIDESES